MPHCSGAVMAIGGLKWSLWGRLDHLYMMLSLCCQTDKKMLEWTSVISYPASLSLFQGNNVPNFLSWTATTPFLAMQVDWEWLHPQLQWWAGPSLAKPRSLVQDGHMTILTSGQSDVRKHLLGPSEKEALCSLENATKWYVLSSYCLDQGQAPGAIGSHLLTLRTVSRRKEQILCVAQKTGEELTGPSVMLSLVRSQTNLWNFSYLR